MISVIILKYLFIAYLIIAIFFIAITMFFLPILYQNKEAAYNVVLQTGLIGAGVCGIITSTIIILHNYADCA